MLCCILIFLIWLPTRFPFFSFYFWQDLFFSQINSVIVFWTWLAFLPQYVWSRIPFITKIISIFWEDLFFLFHHLLYNKKFHYSLYCHKILKPAGIHMHHCCYLQANLVTDFVTSSTLHPPPPTHIFQKYCSME